MKSNATDLVSIGKRIKEQREINQLTQSELAKKLSIKREVVNYWENGKRDAKTENISLLADVLNTTCDYILRGIPTENIDIAEATGLNNSSIERIKKITNIPARDEFIDLSKALNCFLSSDGLTNFLIKFWKFQAEVEALEEEKKSFLWWLNRFDIKPQHDILKQAATILLETIEIDLHRAAKQLLEQKEKVNYSLYSLQKGLDRITNEYIEAGVNNGNDK